MFNVIDDIKEELFNETITSLVPYLKRSKIKLTCFERFSGLDDILSPLPGVEEEVRGVAQVVVLDAEVLDENGPLRKPECERAKEVVVLVLLRVVAVPGREDVLVHLHHGEHRRAQEVLGCSHHVRGVLPHPERNAPCCQRSGTIKKRYVMVGLAIHRQPTQ